MERKPQSNMYEICLMQVRADRAMRTMIAKQLEPHKLTMMEWLALGVIAAAPKQGFSMSYIGETLDVTLPQVTALVVSLTDLKLIKQKVLSSDRRGRQVAVTLKGRRLLSKLERITKAAMSQWNKGIPVKQLQVYMQTISQLAGRN